MGRCGRCVLQVSRCAFSTLTSTCQIHSSIDKPCKNSSSLLGSIQLGVSATSHRSTLHSSAIIPVLTCFILHAGILMPTIPLTVSLACRLHSIMCSLHPHGERRCAPRGRVRMAYVRLPLPSCSAGQRKTVDHMLSARLRTE
jgi:hypothetical protein